VSDKHDAAKLPDSTPDETEEVRSLSVDLENGDSIELPVDAEGEIDWDAYYSDPRLWERVNADVAARRHGQVPVIPRVSANGSVMAAMMLGLREVFDPKAKQEIVVQRDDSGDPDRPDKPMHLEFDPDDPRATKATVRSWARKRKRQP
jgi:hypothetical protein